MLQIFVPGLFKCKECASLWELKDETETESVLNKFKI